MALGSALILLAISETKVAANVRGRTEAFYAADAAFERALVDLNTLLDWDPMLATDGLLSAFTDGAPGGVRILADGSVIDLSQVVNFANCQKATPCSAGDLSATTAERPWAANNPRWRLYAYGRLADVSGDDGSIRSPFYIVTLVGDDGGENDGEASRDGVSVGGVPNPGFGVIAVRTEAFGPGGSHAAIDATIARIDTGSPAVTPGVRVLSWRERE